MKKFLTSTTIVFLFISSLTAQNIGIGTNSPNASAALDINNTSKGLLIPRMTSTQRTAIVSPANGLMVYDITTNSFWYYNGGAWTNLTVAGSDGTLTLPYDATVAVTTTAFKIKNDEYYNAIEGESTYGTGISGKSVEGPGVAGTSVIHNGVYGYSASGYGVNAVSGSGHGLHAHSGTGEGIYASSNSNSAIIALTNNTNPSINAINSNNSGIAIKGHASASATNNVGVEGSSVNGYGVSAFSTSGIGLKAICTNGIGIYANSETRSAIVTASDNSYPTISAENLNAAGEAIHGSSPAYNAIVGVSSGISKAGVRGEATAASGSGVFGTSTQTSGIGVYGNVTSGTGVYGFSQSGTGVKAFSANGLALEVIGDVKITGGNVAPTQGAVLTSDASGNATWKNNRVAFRAKGIASGQIGLSNDYSMKIHFGTEDYDYSNGYILFTGGTPTSSASTFVVIKPGVYNLGASAELLVIDQTANITQANIIIKLKRGSTISTIAIDRMIIVNDALTSSATGITITDYKLLAGDIVWAEAYQINSGEVGGTLQYAEFFAHLVIAD